MPLFMYQGAYSSESWAAQIKNPQNRVEQSVVRRVRPLAENWSEHGYALVSTTSSSSLMSRAWKVWPRLRSRWRPAEP
jgi:hypothetical protein